MKGVICIHATSRLQCWTRRRVSSSSVAWNMRVARRERFIRGWSAGGPGLRGKYNAPSS